MVNMDVKGIAWVGHVYQKFEAMCLEVEEIVYKDTAKYVENQVETVGASVKKFYSDVMQDLIPPSSMDPVKVAAPHLPTEQYEDVGDYKKPKKVVREQLTEEFKVSDKNEVVCSALPLVGLSYTDYSLQQASGNSFKEAHSQVYNRKCNKGSMHYDSNPGVEKNTENMNLSPNMSGETNHMAEDLRKASSSSSVVLSKNHQSLGDEMAMLSSPVEVSSFDFIEGSDNDIDDASECMPEFSMDNSSSDYISVKSVRNKRTDMRPSSCSSSSAELNDMRKNNEGISLGNPSVDPSIQHNEYFDKEFLVPDSGRQYEWNTDAIKMEQPDKAFLEKSCVMVSGDELHFVPSPEDKRKPYKKKIRDAFSLRMSSARKWEYEQLAKRYGNDPTSHQQSTANSTSTLLVENTKSQPKHDISESEWEVL